VGQGGGSLRLGGAVLEEVRLHGAVGGGEGVIWRGYSLLDMVEKQTHVHDARFGRLVPS
jgi:hypothetical protein